MKNHQSILKIMNKTAMYWILIVTVTENGYGKRTEEAEFTRHSRGGKGMTAHKLTDKTGAEFPIIRDGNTCRSVLLNGKKLNLLDRQNDLSRLGLWATRLYFTTENAREVDRVLAGVLNPMPFDPGASTRGLYLRGVE